MDKKVLEKLEQLEKIVARMAANMVTKADAKNFATKDDLKNFATKDDLYAMKVELIKEIRDTEGWIVGTTDKNKTNKEEFAKLKERVDRLERKVVA